MSWTIQDHADAVLDLLRADAELVVYDGMVPKAPAGRYVLVYLLLQTPDGLAAPDKVPFSGDSDVVDMWIYCHCVGGGQLAASNSRAVAGRVRNQLLNARLTLPGRTCFPIRWREGQPPQRNEEIPGQPVTDLVDVYGWVTTPA